MSRKTPIAAAAAGLALIANAPAATAAEAVREVFGQLSTGETIEAVTLSNAKGVSARVMTLGATLQSLKSPDRKGRIDDIVLGFDSPQPYADATNYFGVSVGRYANRIANGAFSIDGEAYQLDKNNNGHHLHGGFNGLDRKVWKLETVESGPVAKAVFSITSPDGDGGYPGELRVTATYALNDVNELTLTYTATTTKPTIVNLTNHAFFNLSGAQTLTDIGGHRLQMNASRYTPVDAGLIPTGELRPVEGSVFDFRKPRRIGADWRNMTDPQMSVGLGYDHNWVLDNQDGKQRLAARLEDPVSGRRLDITTDKPGLQFYSGNFLDGKVTGKNKTAYRQGDGLCLEPQVYPDSPNRPEWPTSRLNPGETYVNSFTYTLSAKAKR